MAKTKMKNIHKPLVITGYALFALLVVSVFVSTTIPFATIIAHPHAIKINATIVMIALTVGALLPVLVGYFVGDQSIKSKSKLSHHFNGILFGLLAYWWVTLMAAFASIPVHVLSDNNLRLVLTNLIPSIFVAIVTCVIAAMHVRSKQARYDVLEYKPFVVVLVASIVAMSLLPVINNVLTNSVNVYTFVTPMIIFVLGTAVYLTLRKRKLSQLQKVAWSAISISVLFLIIFVANMFETAIVSYLWQPGAEVQTISTWIAFAVALMAWVVYWAKQLKVLPSGKK